MKDHGHRSNPGDLVLAFLGGAAMGAVIVYLTAPRSGQATQARWRSQADDVRARAERVPDALTEAVEAARDAFLKALEPGAADEPQHGAAHPHTRRSGA